MKWRLFALVLIFTGEGCGGTWVDDKHNFARAFGSKQPADLEVVHSVYTQTPHFTEEHEFYFELRPLTNSKLMTWVTNAPGIVRAGNPGKDVPFLKEGRPKWFAPLSLTNYEVWATTNNSYVVFRDRRQQNVFIYGSFGM